MRVAIVGAGAMGGMFAYLLSRTGEEIWLVDKHPERAEKIRRDGLRIEGVSGEHMVRVSITTRPEEIGSTDLVLIFVKAYDTRKAARDALPLVGEDTLVLTLQNGLGNLEAIGEVVGEERVAGGITSHGATLLGAGHVRHAGKGETVIGMKTGPGSPRLRPIVHLFSTAGIETKITEDLEGLIWGKLLINVGINPLTAITGLRNGQLLHFPETRELLRWAVEEAHKVAQAKGIKLLYADPVERTEEVCRATADNISSMLQDVRRGKQTEVDFINGAIVREGEKVGVPTPVNRILTLLVKFMGRGYRG